MKDNNRLILMCFIENTIAIVVWAALAISFSKWWIALFAGLFMTTVKFKKCDRVICDGCGRYSQKAEDLPAAIDKARNDGWIRRKVGDTWEDYCPECQAKGLPKEERP